MWIERNAYTMQPSAITLSDKTSTSDVAAAAKIPPPPPVITKPKRRCLRLDCGHIRDVFYTTFYRIWMYRRRHLLTTLMQILIPPLILIGMTAYLGTLLELDTKQWSDYDPLNEAQLQQMICGKYCEDGHKGIIALYMKHNNTKFSNVFSKELRDRLAKFDIELELADKMEDLVKAAIQHDLKGDHEKYIAGIEIDNPSRDDPKGKFGIGKDFELHFTVAMAQKVPGFVFVPTPVFFDLNRNDPRHYYKLLGIEVAVCRTFYQLVQAGNTQFKVDNPLSIEVQSLSYPPHKAYTLKKVEEDENIDEDKGIEYMLAPIFILSMVPCFFTIVEGPVTEKENGFKLYLQLMGFPRGAYWFHWILNQMMVQVIVITIQVTLLFFEIDPNAGPIVKYGDPSLWAIILVLFNLSCLSFFAFIAAFGRRGKSSTYIGILIWLLSYHVLQSHIFDFGSTLSVFMITCLIPSGCIHWAVYIFATATSITWEISTSFSLTQKSHFTLAHVLIMMALNFFIYFLLTLYVDNLNPGPLGIGQPWNYFFQSIRCRFIDPNKSIFGGGSATESSTAITSSRKRKGSRSRRCSVTDSHAIQFKKISKKFYLTDGVYGIENVQFTVYPSQITVLLGHKDSGKTTLLRLLFGAYAPTSGTVIVFDYDMKRDAQIVQSFLNLCMQNDMLCDYLTVMEHLRLIAKLKGVSGKDADEELKNILESVGLLSQKDDMMWKLANWQRRVLCVAMALIGDAPVLVLDEPTAGLDINSKRLIWALLKDLKADGKTILITSRDIGDTYQVADKIVLMSRGRVAGVGTPAKIENIFETGYHLTLSVIANANTDEILSFLQTHIKTARLREGGLKRVYKAIQVENWEQQSQGPIGILKRQKSSKTIVNIPRQESVANTSLNVLDDITISKVVRQPGPRNSKRESSILGMEVSYVLPAQERVNFPSLFRALKDVATAMNLGIKEYELKWHSIENAFDEVDDFVDVLDATRSSGDVILDNILDNNQTKIVRVLSDEPFDEPMPHFEFTRERKYCSFWKGLWAIVIKRICYIIGNYRPCLYQMMAPLVILLVTIYSTNVHFTRELLSPEISYSASVDLIAPIVPFRIQAHDNEAEKLLESFKRVAKRPPNDLRKFKNIRTASFKDYYNEINWHKLHDEVVIAADFTNASKLLDRKVTALFSPGHQHSAPLSLLVMFNSILNHEFPKKDYRIFMTGKSMLHTRQYAILLNTTYYSKRIFAEGVDITLTVSLAFGCFIFASGFIKQPCAERLCKLKRYQMYNLNWNGLYWIANSLVDLMMNNLVIILLTLVIYYAPSHNVFKNPEFIILFIITGSLGGFASIITSYYMSHYLLNKSTSYYAMISINQFLGLFLFLFYTIINFDYFETYAAKLVAFCLQLIQPFTVPWNYYVDIMWAISKGRCHTLNELVLNELCDPTHASSYSSAVQGARDECCSKDSKKWNLEFIKKGEIITPLWSNIVFLTSHCVVGTLILMYMESKRRRRNHFFLSYKPETPPALIDPKDKKSIENEEYFIQETIPQMKKDYRKKLFIVENLSTSIYERTLLHPMSFVAEPGKCTVIVGPETSGITVLYEIISGLRAISEGSVSYGGFSLFSWGSRRKLLQQLGLSPSQDIILNRLTGKHLLKLFGRLRGIPEKELSIHVNYWVRRLGLSKKIKKQCKSYSVVIRKKLAIACAVIGNPSVLIFEEPTKDLDPVSKSEVCKVISSLIYANRVVIILTHDLGSVQHLCSKLIILVNGQMQFCEKTEDIYEEIEDDYTLTIKLKGDERGKIDFQAFTTFATDIEETIESMTLQEEQSHLLKYRIINSKSDWADLFETVEKIVSKHESVVLDYNIRKTGLEDIYGGYAGKQRMFRATESAWDEFRTTYC